MSTKQYTDRKGRTWDLSLDLLTCERINASDFSALPDPPGPFSIYNHDKIIIGRLITDARFMFALIWAIVQPQVKEKYQTWQAGKPEGDGDHFPIDPKDAEAAELEFISGVNGSTIVAARNALFEALYDFFPEQKTALSLLMKQLQKAQEKVASKLAEVEPILDQMMDLDLEEGIDRLKSRMAKTRDERLSEISSA